MSRQHVQLTAANVYAEMMEATEPINDCGGWLYTLGRRQTTSKHPDYRTLLAILRKLTIEGKVTARYFPSINHTIFYATERVRHAGE
jgi:hypothetical protein